MRIALVLALAGVLSCARDSATSYTIGIAGPWRQGYGAMSKRGIDLAIEEINAAGGIDGRPLRVVSEDDNGEGQRAAAIAEKFVRDESVLAVVGHVNSGAMLAAAPVYDGEIAALATSASSPELTGISSWTFRVISSDSLNAAILARYAASLTSQPGVAPTAAILFENNSYGRGLADAFRRSFTGELVTVDPFDEKITNVEPYISFLKSKNPGIVFVAGRVPSGLRLLREARRQELAAQFFGGDGWQGIVADTAASEGALVGTSFTADDPSPKARQFVGAFRKRFGIVPDAHAALSYDATKLMAAAIRASGPSRVAIRDYLAALDAARPYEGVTGRTFFDRNGDPVGMGFRIARIEGGNMRHTAGR